MSVFFSFFFLIFKTAGSLGALTGFAIAVVFAWKFFRSPPGMRRITPSTSQPAGGVGSSSEGLAPVLDMKVSDAAEAISASIQVYFSGLWSRNWDWFFL